MAATGEPSLLTSTCFHVYSDVLSAGGEQYEMELDVTFEDGKYVRLIRAHVRPYGEFDEPMECIYDKNIAEDATMLEEFEDKVFENTVRHMKAQHKERLEHAEGCSATRSEIRKAANAELQRNRDEEFVDAVCEGADAICAAIEKGREAFEADHSVCGCGVTQQTTYASRRCLHQLKSHGDEEYRREEDAMVASMLEKGYDEEDICTPDSHTENFVGFNHATLGTEHLAQDSMGIMCVLEFLKEQGYELEVMGAFGIICKRARVTT